MSNGYDGEQRLPIFLCHIPCKFGKVFLSLPRIHQKRNIMEIFIGMSIFIALVIGFMVINDIGERNPIEKLREELGEKILKDEDENQP